MLFLRLRKAFPEARAWSSCRALFHAREASFEACGLIFAPLAPAREPVSSLSLSRSAKRFQTYPLIFVPGAYFPTARWSLPKAASSPGYAKYPVSALRRFHTCLAIQPRAGACPKRCLSPVCEISPERMRICHKAIQENLTDSRSQFRSNSGLLVKTLL